MKPKIYVVVTEKYVGGGAVEPLELELHYAHNLEDLADQLGWDSWEELKEGHGDGADGYVIKEMKGPDENRLALVDILPEPE